jgi:hypothetical protein
MKRAHLAALSLCAGIAACAAPSPAVDEAAYTAQARSVAAGMQQNLAGKLFAEINKGGPASAIGVCTTMAPDVSAAMSREKGWRITRVSLKTRNPVLGMPDAWEQRVLASFDGRVAQGVDPATLEHAEVVAEPQGRSFRYMKALPVQPLCVNCHGSADKIPADVKARLAAQYPHDRATGYAPGQVRGAISIKRPLD